MPFDVVGKHRQQDMRAYTSFKIVRLLRCRHRGRDENISHRAQRRFSTSRALGQSTMVFFVTVGLGEIVPRNVQRPAFASITTGRPPAARRPTILSASPVRLSDNCLASCETALAEAPERTVGELMRGPYPASRRRRGAPEESRPRAGGSTRSSADRRACPGTGPPLVWGA